MAAPALLNKVFLVTGSTDGIGLHTAQKLASQGATVLVHGRSEARVAQAVHAVQQAGQASGGSAQGYTADLASLAGVRRLAAAVSADCPALHALVNNAGVYEPRPRTSEDGLELTWAVNVAAPFLLTSLLLGRVAGRVVNVASISAASTIDFGNLQQERGYSAHAAYSLSKLADIMLSFELAARLAAAGSGVTCTCLDPGTVNTKMLAAGWGSIGMRLQDANFEFEAAADPALARVSGEYFVGGRPSRAPPPAHDAAARRRLWEVLQEQTGAAWSV